MNDGRIAAIVYYIVLERPKQMKKIKINESNRYFIRERFEIVVYSFVW